MRIHTRPSVAVVTAVVAVALLAGAGTLVGAQDPATALEEVLRSTRAALGGAALEKVTSLGAEGEFRRTLGERELSGDIELKLSGSDKFLWIESMSPTGDPTMRVVRTSGFNGTTTLESMTGGGGMMRFGGPGGPGGAGPGGPGAAGQGSGAGAAGARPEDTPEARQARQLRMQQRQAARVMLALLLKPDGPLPLEFAYGGEADSDDGKADVIVVKGPDNLSAQIYVDKQTHLPLVLGYRDVQQRMFRMGPGGAAPGAPGAQPGQPPPTREEIEQRMREARERARTEPPTVVDVQWYLSDHKKVNGVMLPHTIRRAENGEVREEWTFRKFTINPVFKPDTFEKK